MRQIFERELQKVQDATLSLGSMVETGLLDAVDVLGRRDCAGSKRIIEWDTWVNEKRFAIEAEVLALIARQQPVAKDMRALAGILEISGELERIGDYAKGIAKINLMLAADFPHEVFIEKIRDMGHLASQMIHEALQAFTWGDVVRARKMPALDDTLDALYQDVYREVIATVIQQPALLDNGNNIIWAAHNLERAGDRAVNICERVIFTVTGEMVELGVG